MNWRISPVQLSLERLSGDALGLKGLKGCAGWCLSSPLCRRKLKDDWNQSGFNDEPARYALTRICWLMFFHTNKNKTAPSVPVFLLFPSRLCRKALFFSHEPESRLETSSSGDKTAPSEHKYTVKSRIKYVKVAKFKKKKFLGQN